MCALTQYIADEVGADRLYAFAGKKGYTFKGFMGFVSNTFVLRTRKQMSVQRYLTLAICFRE